MNNEKYTDFTTGSNDQGKRIDRIIRQFIREQNLSTIYKAFRKGLIRLNGNKVKPDYKVTEGEVLSVYKSLLENHREMSDEKSEENYVFKNQIIFEDDDLIAINKKSGQLVHGEKGSLEESVRNYLTGKIAPSLSFRPGPLHRLDRNTSGLIFFSKSISGARNFSQKLQDKNLSKYYVALLDGKLNKKEIWIDNLQRETEKRVTIVNDDGKESKSTAYPLHYYKGYTLALIKIETGRTHQIRSQAAHHQYPLSGDRKYGGSQLNGGYFLHSLTLISENEKSSFLNGKIRASLSKEQLKRLNRVLSNCTIEELNGKITIQPED